ncbi:MAG TPA: hypothetical protein VM325_06095 [Alphaproteobacteria bacterium]|nr:hypothetical protein [Alphaproteobacteria bacterium]
MRRRISQQEWENERIAFPLTLHRFAHRFEFATTFELDDAAGEPLLRGRFDMAALRGGEPTALLDGADDSTVLLRLRVVELGRLIGYSVSPPDGPVIGGLVSSFRPEARPQLHFYRPDGEECGRLTAQGVWKRALGLLPFMELRPAFGSSGSRTHPHYTIDVDGRPGMSLRPADHDPQHCLPDTTLSSVTVEKHNTFGAVDEQLILAGLAVMAGHHHLDAFSGNFIWLELWS